MKEEWKIKDKPDKWKLAGSQILLSVKRPTLHCLSKKKGQMLMPETQPPSLKR